MKRLFFFGFVLVWCVTAPVLARAAKPWGVLHKVVEETSFSVYGVDNLIDRRPIRYAVSEEVTPEQEKIFVQNILAWPLETLRLIKRAGREKEFADIRDILLAAKVIKASETENPDILLAWSEDVGIDADGDFIAKKDDQPFNLIRINKLVDKMVGVDFRATSLHELGHYFGLADQYENGRTNAHAEYSSDVNQQDEAVMQGSFQTHGQITCDDVDGFINLMDLRLSQRHNGQFSTRAQNGWKSLCPNATNIYKKAKTINRRETDTLTTPGYGKHIEQRIYENGNLKYTVSTVFASPLGIFFAEENDLIKRNPRTHLITSIIGVRMAQVPTPSGEAHDAHDAHVPYERYFTYGPLTPAGITVSVQEILNGKPLQTQQVTIHADGSLTGIDEVKLQHNTYHVFNDWIRVYGYLSAHVGASFVIKDCINNLTLSLEADGGLFFERPGRQIQHSPTPPQRDSDFYLLWLILRGHKDSLESYYKNFYEPLFPTQGQEQLQQKIRQGLNIYSR